MTSLTVEKHHYHSGTREKQLAILRSKFTDKGRIVDRQPRPKTEYAEIEHSLGAPKHDTYTLQKVRTISSHTKCMISFYGGAIQCIGMRNGSISIGDWLSEDRHRTYKIGLSDKNTFEGTHRSVKKLLYHDDHIIAGLADGTVIFFDLLQDKVVQREYYHRSPVIFLSAIAAHHRIVSVSADGHVVNYSTEQKSNGDDSTRAFPVVNECHYDEKLSTGYIAADALILGTSSGALKIIDIVDTKKVYCAVRVCSNGSPITALWRTYATLVVGTGDGKIRIYEVTDRRDEKELLLSKILHYHEARIVSLYYDTFAMRFWSADASGIIIAWDKSPRTSHEILSYHNIGEPIRDVSFAEIAHATAFWTTASNGKNVLRWTSMSHASRKVEKAILSIDRELDARQSELQIGFSHVDRVEEIEQKAFQRFPRLGFLARRRRLLGYYFWRLRRFVYVLQTTRQLEATKSIVSRKTYETALCRTFGALLENVARRKTEFLRQKSQAYTKLCRHRLASGPYFYAWRSYYEDAHARSESLKHRLEEFASQRVRCELPKFYTELLLHSRVTYFERKVKSLADCLRTKHTLRLAQKCYAKLRMCRILRESASQMEDRSRQLLDRIRREIVSSCMHKIRQLRGASLEKLRMSRLADSLRRHRERLTIRKAYGNLSIAKIRSGAKNTKAQEESEVKTLNDLREKARLLQEREAAIALNETLVAELTDIEKSQSDQHERIESFKAAIETRHRARQERPAATVTDQLLQTMASLKCAALNFDADVVLIQKTVERANSLAKSGASRIFLRAHLDIKRTIVSVFGEQPKKKHADDRSTPLTYTWGTDAESIIAAVRQFPVHTHAALLEAIKRMIISFDMLSPEELVSIDADKEIVANANGLLTMYTYLAEKRSKKAISARLR
ncbi:jouberin [Perkinsela sp. CCAP 1560/4]|nr:jouberin [Perkinsela sp. CCAP 1560/4]|eukprot:KNH05308.1 jouberin [Perkinsela sp. CCAP 1560/4]